MSDTSTATAVLNSTELLDVIQRRWSPRAFSSRPVAAEELALLFEAARWAPSAMNDQPWTFVLGDKHTNPDTYTRIFDTLVPQNQAWAQAAPVLVLVLARTVFARNGRPSPTALYDTGMAAAQLVLQATALGLVIHQMGGFEPGKAREYLSIPEQYHPVAVMAIGWPGDADTLSEELRERERAPRQRKPVNEVVLTGPFPASGSGSPQR